MKMKTKRLTKPDPPLALRYLDFDYSEDALGWGNFDAMASVLLPQRIALQDEVAQVLNWAHRAFAHQQAPLDEGGEWDYDLQARQEVAAPGPERHTLTLSISGTAPFCAAFKQQFDLD